MILMEIVYILWIAMISLRASPHFILLWNVIFSSSAFYLLAFKEKNNRLKMDEDNVLDTRMQEVPENQGHFGIMKIIVFVKEWEEFLLYYPEGLELVEHKQWKKNPRPIIQGDFSFLFNVISTFNFVNLRNCYEHPSYFLFYLAVASSYFCFVMLSPGFFNLISASN